MQKGDGREVDAEVLRDSALLWPFVWCRCNDGVMDPLEADARPTTGEEAKVTREGRAGGGGLSSNRTSSESSGSSGDDEDVAGGRVEGALRCDDGVLRQILWRRYVSEGSRRGGGDNLGGSSAALSRDVSSANAEIEGDGWHVRLLTDQESLVMKDSNMVSMIEPRMAGAGAGNVVASKMPTQVYVKGGSTPYPSTYPGAAVTPGPRLALFWEKPLSLEACQQRARSLSSALVATRSVDLIVALAAEVVAAVLSPTGICESGSRLHDVRGFEQATLHLARGHRAAAASHARRAAANLPWIKRQALRRSAKTKVRRALSRLKGVTGLLSAAKGSLGLSALRKLRDGDGVAGNRQGEDGVGAQTESGMKGRAEKGGDKGSSQWSNDRALLWAAAEEKRLDDEARELVAWKGKVGIEALLLALGAGFESEGEDADDGARAVLAAALCSVSGAQLCAVGATASAKDSMLRHALWRRVMATVPHDVRARVDGLVQVLPVNARPDVPWHRAAGRGGSVAGARTDAHKREQLQRFISPLSSPALRRYLTVNALADGDVGDGADAGRDLGEGGGGNHREWRERERRVDELLSGVYSGNIGEVKKSLSEGADPLAGNA